MTYCPGLGAWAAPAVGRCAWERCSSCSPRARTRTRREGTRTAPEGRAARIRRRLRRGRTRAARMTRGKGLVASDQPVTAASQAARAVSRRRVDRLQVPARLETQVLPAAPVRQTALVPQEPGARPGREAPPATLGHRVRPAPERGGTTRPWRARSPRGAPRSVALRVPQARWCQRVGPALGQRRGPRAILARRVILPGPSGPRAARVLREQAGSLVLPVRPRAETRVPRVPRVSRSPLEA